MEAAAAEEDRTALAGVRLEGVVSVCADVPKLPRGLSVSVVSHLLNMGYPLRSIAACLKKCPDEMKRDDVMEAWAVPQLLDEFKDITRGALRARCEPVQ